MTQTTDTDTISVKEHSENDITMVDNENNNGLFSSKKDYDNCEENAMERNKEIDSSKITKSQIPIITVDKSGNIKSKCIHQTHPNSKVRSVKRLYQIEKSTRKAHKSYPSIKPNRSEKKKDDSFYNGAIVGSFIGAALSTILTKFITDN